jgi:hypothetical protein
MKSAPVMQPLTPQRDPKKRTDKWFLTTRGTHWMVAGSVTVIILGSYLIYGNHYTNPTIASPTPAGEQNVVPTPSGLSGWKGKTRTDVRLPVRFAREIVHVQNRLHD